MDLTGLVIAGLAAHKLWLLYLTQDLFQPLRTFIGRWIHPKLASCGVCVSVWIGAAIVASDVVPYGYYVIAALAVSEMIGVLDTALGAVERTGTRQ